MSFCAGTGKTKTGDSFVELTDGDGRTVLKAYASPDGAKLRIVLPELANYAQTLIRPDLHLIDFERDASRAKSSVQRRY